MLRSKRNKSKGVLFFMLLLTFAFAGWFAWNLRPLADEARMLAVAEGMGADEIARLLADEGMVRSRWAFNLYGYLSGRRARLQAGQFSIPAHADVAEIIGILTMGAGARERTVIIIEGWTLKQIDASLAKENVFPAGAFVAATAEVRKKCALADVACHTVNRIPANAATLEGYLFPDTYRLFYDAAPNDLIEKMLIRFSEKTNDASFQTLLHNSGFPFHDVVTMASLIEAEVPHARDRALVAGLFWKRIGAGMPLQADATINYITGKQERSASLTDLKINSPYNTYLYPDLPPGPIGNPGIGALMAAVQPLDSPYWFYLSAPDGATIFSKTFEEHKAAKAKYL